MRPAKDTAPRSLEILKTALFRTPTRFFCEDCGKYVPSTMPWVCSRCGTVHEDVRLHSFLTTCKECKQKPDGIECPHCKTVWSFRKRGEPKHIARKAERALPKPPPLETEAAKRKREHEEKKEALDREREIADLTQKLEEVRNQGGKKRDRILQETEEEIMADFYKLVGTEMTLERLRNQLKGEIKDPEQLSRMLEYLTEIERRRA